MKSMTAFARNELIFEGGQINWELRSVNHRYAEISLRLPDELRGLESSVRDAIAQRVKRGKVDAALRLKLNDGGDGPIVVDTDRVQSLLQACSVIEDQMGNPDRISALDVLRWPGVMQVASVDLEQLGPQVLAALEATLQELVENRDREGEQIAGLLAQRCDAIREQVAIVRANLTDILDAQRQRLLKQFDELQSNLDPERLEQEMVIQAQKMDVDEELDRLDVHLLEMARVLDQDQPVGRRLDFLMQEFNREINTLASKSVAGVTSQAAVEMKVIVEQMREQIQNVE